MSNSAALVLFSGGQDSTVCLAWTLARFDHVETVGFDYGQRHASELAARPGLLAAFQADFAQWTGRLGPDHLLPLDTLKAIGGSALTDAMAITMGEHGLPNTFVPGRNVMFLTAAAALGYRRGIFDLVGGMCETDFSGYPDCRDETVKATARALSLGLAQTVEIHTPLMWIDKAATWALAQELGGARLVDLILEETVTCYEGDRSHRHGWGYGCGVLSVLQIAGGRLQEISQPVTYSVKEIFYTLQGEGAQAGRPSVFLRFAGCNLWSGLEKDRADAICQFCDTDFIGTNGAGGGKFSDAASLARAVKDKWPGREGKPYVVCTGGEPLLQLDAALVDALHAQDFEIAIETNGTLEPPEGIDWICVSPKANTQQLLRRGDELKLVYPQDGGDPQNYLNQQFGHFFLQPMDGPEKAANTRKAVDYCLSHPQWRLSLQTHKILGIS